jgi:thymidine kinase
MSIELIIGPMFAGKSSAILQRIRRAKAIGRNVLIVTSILDTRYDSRGVSIKTHDQEGVTAIGLGINDLTQIMNITGFNEAHMIIIEEAQFFNGLYDIVQSIVESYKKDVIIVGLDGDSDRKPFGDILKLIPLADRVMKLAALCKRCCDGTEGHFTALVADKGGKKEQIYVGGADKYLPMCRSHYLENLTGHGEADKVCTDTEASTLASRHAD